MEVLLRVLFVLNAGCFASNLGARLAPHRMDFHKEHGSSVDQEHFDDCNASASKLADDLELERDPLQIYIRRPELKTCLFEACSLEIAEHQLTYFNKSSFRSVMCNPRGNAMLWDTRRSLEFYFGITARSSSRAFDQYQKMLEEAKVAGGRNPALADLADCCEDEAEDCCSSCKEMVSFDSLKDAILTIDTVRQRLCSEEALSRSEGTWEELLLQAQRAKWDSPTERGERCIDPAECDTNGHFRGKSWCYINSTRRDLHALFWHRPWDYCMLSIRYMCVTNDIDCEAARSESQCSLGSDVDSCMAIPGCAFKASLCVPAEFELLDPSKPHTPEVVSGKRPKRRHWQDYYRNQLDLLLAQVAAEQRQYTDVIEVCSRLPYRYCMAPCTRHGFGSSLLFGKMYPWESPFGYCSLHGHYRAKSRKEWDSENMNKLMEAMQLGVAEFGSKLFNGVPVMLSFLTFQHFHPKSVFPAWFQECFFGIFCKTVMKGHDLLDSALHNIFSSLASDIPGLFHSNAFYMIVKAPLVEEVVYRGIVQGAVRLVADQAVRGVMSLVEHLGLFNGRLEKREVLERYVFAVTQLTTSFCFAYMHTWSDEWQVTAVAQAVFSFWSGLSFQVIHQKFGLHYSVVSHFTNNALAHVWNVLKPDIATLIAEDPELANILAEQRR